MLLSGKMQFHKSFPSTTTTDGFATNGAFRMMDARMDDQQQKDYMASFFPNVDLNHLQTNGMDLMQQPALNSQQSQSMMPGLSMPPQLDMEMLGNLMSMQGLASPHHHQLGAASPSQSHFPSTSNTANPQMIMEQQFKLAQLQQLQQLQNQIFQQQVSSLPVRWAAF